MASAASGIGPYRAKSFSEHKERPAPHFGFTPKSRSESKSGPARSGIITGRFAVYNTREQRTGRGGPRL